MGPRGSETLAFTRICHVESGILREEYILLSRSKRDNVEKITRMDKGYRRDQEKDYSSPEIHWRWGLQDGNIGKCIMRDLV